MINCTPCSQSNHWNLVLAAAAAAAVVVVVVVVLYLFLVNWKKSQNKTGAIYCIYLDVIWWNIQ